MLGVGIITAFVFLGSEDTIDAPSLDESAPGQTPAARGEQRPGIQD